MGVHISEFDLDKPYLWTVPASARPTSHFSRSCCRTWFVLHKGEAVESGVKYVLRGDVFFTGAT